MKKPELHEYLSCVRPDGSRIERDFINRRIIERLPTTEDCSVSIDPAGNTWVSVGTEPGIAWSCHTDTVATGYDPKQGYRPPVLHETEAGRFYESPDAGCLGADDGTGIWMMMRMILEHKPGLYIFHRGEEVGGTGSNYAALHETSRLMHVRCMIALDRMDYVDVITHQSGSRCCSNRFAQSLADAIGIIPGYGSLEPCSGGVFTDTANYIDVIGECTNLSVGYFSQHTKDEVQDVDFAHGLLERLLEIEESQLSFSRDPKEEAWEEWDKVLTDREYWTAWDEANHHGRFSDPVGGDNWPLLPDSCWPHYYDE